MLKAALRKLCPSYGNEETFDKVHKLVMDIGTTAHDFKLEIEGEIIDKLLEICDHKQTTNKIK